MTIWKEIIYLKNNNNKSFVDSKVCFSDRTCLKRNGVLLHHHVNKLVTFLICRKKQKTKNRVGYLFKYLIKWLN